MSRSSEPPQQTEEHIFGYLLNNDSTQMRPQLPSLHSLFDSDSETPFDFTDHLPDHLPNVRPQQTRSPLPLQSQDFIDLTNDSSPPPSPMPPRRRRPSAEPARKRRRLTEPSQGHGNSSQAIDLIPEVSPETEQQEPEVESDEIEEVDLTHVQNDRDLRQHQADQRRRHEEMEEQQNQLLKDSVTAQQTSGASASNLSSISCVICMETITDMTATYCGHIFCHTCIMEALIAGERQGNEPGKGLSRCPVCRKKVTRSEGKTKDPQQVIPLEFKFIRRSAKARGKQREPGQSSQGQSAA